MAIAGACNRPQTLTAEAAGEKGDEMIRQMSRTLAGLQTFSFTAEEHREKVRANGEKVAIAFTREVIVRRPNAIAFVDKSADRDGGGWYDGKNLTLVSNRQKVWARGPMPGTIDEAVDFLSAEYGVQVPSGDLLYSSPYDALMSKDTKGGWVGVEKIGETSCDHVSYQQSVVDWELWLTQDDRRLPRQLRIKYKSDPGQPVTRLVFSNWNTSAQVSDDTFAAKVPAGYERLKIMRHATVEDKKVTEAAPGGAPSATPQTQPR